jgi:replicative DNA helicase
MAILPNLKKCSMNNQILKNKLTIRSKKADMSPMLYGKMSPQAPELEGAVLGAIMIDPSKMEDVLEIIPSPECFYSDANQRIYASIRRMFDNGTRIDFMTVTAELRKQSEIEMVGGSYYITKLTQDVVSAAHIEEHARIVVEKYIMRELIRTSGEVISDAYEDSTDVFDLLDTASTTLEELSMKQIRKDFEHISTGTMEALNKVLELQMRDDSLSGVPTGFPELDRITGGWQPTDLIILAARPSVGKTAFVLNLILNAVLNAEKPTGVLFFSLEMSTDQIIMRIAANYCDIYLDKIRKGKMNESELKEFQIGMMKIKQMEIYIDDCAGLTSTEIRIKTKKAKRKYNIGMVVIDYLQLMKGSGNAFSRENEISTISRGLKALAKELALPIIALSQLNRLVDSRGSDEPKLSDIRESGAIEQDADVVMFLYKPKDSQGETCLSIAKNRNGILEKFGTLFDGAHQRFSKLMILGQTFEQPHTSFRPATKAESTVIHNEDFNNDEPF